MLRCFPSVIPVLILIIVSCSPRTGSRISVNTPGLNTVPDYSLKAMWAAHPDKKDPSDSIPLPLKSFYTYDSTVDVFFVHPTTHTERTSELWNAPISDQQINLKTDNRPILYQASVFNEYRVFAPRYRQAHLRSYFTNDTTAKRAFDLAYNDVKNAFIYYLEHENNGRPVIIASHSQGSTHAQRLLKDFFDSSSLRSKLIVAYIIGMRIESEHYSTLRLCTDSLETGCITGWRTYRNGYKPDFLALESGKPMVTNPLTWKIDNETASRSLNKGAILQNFNKLVPGAAGAEINDRILSVKELKFPGSFFLRTKNLHIGDINLYYMNIRENVKVRVREYKKTANGAM